MHEWLHRLDAYFPVRYAVWVLSAVGGDLPAAVKGTYMAALNAARIPGFLANAMTSVLVPSIAAALAAGGGSFTRNRSTR